jgi:outer membrane protein TolC
MMKVFFRLIPTQRLRFLTGLPAAGLLLTGMALAQAPASPSAPVTPSGYLQAAPMATVPVGQIGGGDLAGGVSRGKATAKPLQLTLDQAIALGLRNNLAVLVSDTQSQQARAQRRTALAALLPNVNAAAGELRQKVNLAAYGFALPGFPSIVGPFNVFDARGYAEEAGLNLSSIQGWRASKQAEAAAHSTYAETRDMVVLAIANQYLLGIADLSRVQSASAQLATAETALRQALDMKAAGTVDALVVVRAQVERDREHQLLISAQNELDKQKLRLARAIGLPPGQELRIVDKAPYAPLEKMDPASAVMTALADRPDYRAAQQLVRAAQLQVAAARDQRLPSLDLNANYGTIGHEIGSNHPTFVVGMTVRMPVFEGGRIQADVLNAQARLHEVEDRASDLKLQIDNQVRSALLDEQSSAQLVEVARRAQGLAQRELTLAQDRFRAGVADNLEVVQAQQEVAVANENYTNSLYRYNLAKVSLAQALGVAQSAYRRYLGGVK